MTYRVKEIYYTLQGEGTHTGRAAVFCRFTSCNLWTGREKDRHRAICQFCDTDFVGTDGPGGGRFATAADLAAAVSAAWDGQSRTRDRAPRAEGRGAAWTDERSEEGRRHLQSARRRVGEVQAPRVGEVQPFVVCTGGEPLLQLDEPAVDALHAAGFEVAVETNGTRPAPAGLDWVCVSPKAGAPLALTRADELKLVYPQEGASPEMFENLGFPRLLLQPMDGPDRDRNTRLAVEYCLEHPRWRLSLQTHKYLGIA